MRIRAHWSGAGSASGRVLEVGAGDGFVAHLLRDFDAILEERRQLLIEGRDRLTRLLRERLPEWRVPHTSGGLTSWINLGEPVSSQLAIASRNEGLVVAAGPRFGVDGAFERFIRDRR